MSEHDDLETRRRKLEEDELSLHERKIRARLRRAAFWDRLKGLRSIGYVLYAALFVVSFAVGVVLFRPEVEVASEPKTSPLDVLFVEDSGK